MEYDWISGTLLFVAIMVGGDLTELKSDEYPRWFYWIALAIVTFCIVGFVMRVD